MESKLQSKIKNYLKLQGWRVIKTIQLSENGHPDLLCFKKGVTIVIEVKDKGKKPRPLQEFRINEWLQDGFKAFYADSYEMFLEKYGKEI
jgi:Holliday junction resolvase